MRQKVVTAHTTTNMLDKIWGIYFIIIQRNSPLQPLKLNEHLSDADNTKSEYKNLNRSRIYCVAVVLHCSEPVLSNKLAISSVYLFTEKEQTWQW